MTTPTEGSTRTEPAFPEVQAEARVLPSAVRADAPATRVLSRPLLLGVVAAFAGGAVGWFVKPPSPPETRFVNFDAQSTPPEVQTRGWSSFEVNPATGDTFSWCANKSCAVHLQLRRADGDRLVRMRLSAFQFPGAPDQTVAVFVNDTSVGSQPVPGGEAIVSVRAPRSAWRPGLNEVRFDFAYATDPKSKFPGVEDNRTLAAAFDWLEIANATE